MKRRVKTVKHFFKRKKKLQIHFNENRIAGVCTAFLHFTISWNYVHQVKYVHTAAKAKAPLLKGPKMQWSGHTFVTAAHL